MNPKIINLDEKGLTRNYKEDARFLHVYGKYNELLNLIREHKEQISQDIIDAMPEYSEDLQKSLHDIHTEAVVRADLVNFIVADVESGKLKMEEDGVTIKKASLLASIRRFKKDNVYIDDYLTTTEGVVPLGITDDRNRSTRLYLAHIVGNAPSYLTCIERDALCKTIKEIGKYQREYFNTNDEYTIKHREMHGFMWDYRIVFDNDIFNDVDVTEEQLNASYDTYTSIRNLTDVANAIADHRLKTLEEGVHNNG